MMYFIHAVSLFFQINSIISVEKNVLFLNSLCDFNLAPDCVCLIQ